MRAAQNKVRDFHLRNGLEVADRPLLTPMAIAQHRYDLILEELNEYKEAVEKGDLVGIADALGDLLYVVLGTSVVHGIDIEDVFGEVHRSNMTKTPLDPVTRKGGKGPGFERPRVAEILFMQLTGVAQAVRDAEMRRALECVICGHDRASHHAGSDFIKPHCNHTDADGPCACPGFKPASNLVPLRIVGGTTVRG